jgi:hypothetical protein
LIYDSDHARDHVARDAFELYAPFVTPGAT